MARLPFLYAKMDVNYADHPKIAGLSDAAFRAHVEMILYSRKYLSDGLISKRIAKRFGTDSLSELLANDDANPSLTMTDDGDYLLHGFISMQGTREDIEAKSQVNATNGRLGGIAKGKRFAKRNRTETVSQSESESESEKKQQLQLPRSNESSETDPRPFTEFWEQYPRKVGKERARKSWARAVKRADPDDIVKGAGRLARDPNLPDQQFIPHPTTWLDRNGWDDPPFPPPGRTAVRAMPSDRARDVLAMGERFRQAESTDRIQLEG